MKDFSEKVSKGWSMAAASGRELKRKESPAAPVKEEMAVYEKHLKRVKKVKNRALILGATPELRDLALKHGFKVVTVDFDMGMIDVLSSAMKHKNNENETIIRCDWFNMPLEKNNYDVVFSDGSFNNVPFKDFEKLFLIVKSLLRKNGYLLIRHLVLAPDKELRTVEQLIKEYRQKKLKWTDLLFGLYVGCYRTRVWYDPKTKVFNLGKFFDWAKKQKQKDFKKIGKRGRKGLHTVTTKKVFEKMIKRYFKIIDVSSSRNFCFLPIYMLRK